MITIGTFKRKIDFWLQLFTQIPFKFIKFNLKKKINFLSNDNRSVYKML